MQLRALGIAILAIGVILLIYGISASDSVSSSFSRFFTGKPTDNTVWLIIGATVALILGGFMSVGFAGRKSA
jgi:uncharacterized protein DUF3185